MVSIPGDLCLSYFLQSIFIASTFAIHLDLIIKQWFSLSDVFFKMSFCVFADMEKT